MDLRLADLTDEQLEPIKRKAADLVTTQTPVNHACATLIASRQLYALARYTLHEHLQFSSDAETPLVEECLVASMTERAEQPFRRDHLLNSMKGVVLPFLISEIAAEAESEAVQEQLEAKRVEELRVKSAVPITLTSLEIEACVPLLRHEILALVGTQEQLELEIASIRAGINDIYSRDEVSYSTLYLSTEQGNNEMLSARNPQTIVRKYFDFWKGLANSKSALHKQLGVQCRFLRGQRCDLVLVENAAELGAVGQLPDAVRRLRYWCDEQKAALVIGIPEQLSEETSSLGKHCKVVKLDGSERPDFCWIHEIVAGRLPGVDAGHSAEQGSDEAGDSSEAD